MDFTGVDVIVRKIEPFMAGPVPQMWFTPPASGAVRDHIGAYVDDIDACKGCAVFTRSIHTLIYVITFRLSRFIHDCSLCMVSTEF
jgi:hypothetical protein